jgi:signal transduction histidine kinase
LIAGDIKPAEYVENAVLTRSGLERLVAWHNSILYDEAGNIIGTLSSGEDITEKRQAQEALRKAHDELEQRVQERTAELASLNEQLKQEVAFRTQAQQALEEERELLKQLLESSDQDRKLTAYEIHDGLAQQLAAAIMEFDTFLNQQGQNPDEARTTFQRGTEALRESLAEARRLISGLRPPILDEIGVVAAIKHLIDDQAVDAKPHVTFLANGKFDELEPALENTIFRIVQESMTNVRRYSGSEDVRLELTQKDDAIRIEVEDWGVGFAPEDVPDECFGLIGIRERARVLGGYAKIESSPGAGTSITVELPSMLGGTSSAVEDERSSPQILDC